MQIAVLVREDVCLGVARSVHSVAGTADVLCVVVDPDEGIGVNPRTYAVHLIRREAPALR